MATIATIMRSEKGHPPVNITEMADVSSLITRVWMWAGNEAACKSTL